MPRANTTRPSRGNRRIAIDGHFLDEIQTRLYADENTNSLTYVSAPIEQHQVAEDETGITLKLPSLTALQLYRDRVIPTDARKPVELTVAGRELGAFYLQWLRALPGGAFGAPVLLRFERNPAKKEHPYKANAWLTGLTPLKLKVQGQWDPAEEYWAEEGEPFQVWAKPVIKRGPRPLYEMEQILPGLDPEDFDSDPILQANELKDRGQIARAKKLLEKLLIHDIRCLDAHAHLGNLVFDRDVRTAINHYQRGVQIGELSLGEGFEGVLPWGLIDNRPFLRCLNGFGLCLWRLERFEEAEAVFERLLWMSPSDNLGVRFLLPEVKAGRLWSPGE
jgi:tetratricopeptide (TPR) repeat protein